MMSRDNRPRDKGEKRPARQTTVHCKYGCGWSITETIQEANLAKLVHEYTCEKGNS